MSTFQDDNDEIHQAQFMRDWPPQSPELNPTESRQDVLELTLHRLAKKNMQTLIFNWAAYTCHNIVISL